jgi:methionine-rich copper-binding protein CopC
MNSSQRKLLAGSVIILVIGIVIWLVISNLVLFRLKASYPEKNGVLSTASNDITLYFTKPLKKLQNPKPSLVGVSNLNYEISDKQLRLYKGNDILALPVGDYTLKLGPVVAENGQTINEVSISFKKEYVDFNKLPENEQRHQINQSSSFENKYPIIQKLPLTETNYTIDYEVPAENETAGSDRLILVISMNFSAKGAEDGENPYTQSVRKYRKEALVKISSLGYDPSNYRYRLGEDVLIDEFTSYRPGLQLEETYTGDGTPPSQR